jgi:hypothetical protein
MEKWLPFVKDFTFETVFMPLTRDDARAIEHKIHSTYRASTFTTTPEEETIIHTVICYRKYNIDI